MKTKLYLTRLILLLSLTKVSNATIIYVDASKTSGLNNGTAWNNAYISFQSALDSALSGDEIWVAKGTYKPSSAYDLTNTSRYYHFRMKNNVAIYGGFSGIETTVSQRTNFGLGQINETILSGDLNGDDIITGNGATLSFSNNGENCYHVFYHPSGLALNNTAILDGFTIKGGNANDVHPNENGGAMYNIGASPTLKNICITTNFSDYTGGGISNQSSSSTYGNISFIRNQSDYGGGIYSLDSYIIIRNSIVAGNKVAEYGGGLCSNNTAHILENLTITNNVANIGGGIYTAYAPFNLSNCIVWANTAILSGNEVGAFDGGSINYNYSCYKDGLNDEWISNGNISKINSISSNPNFANVYEEDFRIAGNSPCADTGDNTLSLQANDIRGTGFDRKLNKTDGTAGIIDMGAYEYKFGADPLIPCVNPTDAGMIAASQTICSNYAPTIITNSISAAGFSGILEYQWYSSTTSSTSGFNSIANAITTSYQPGILNQTTWFKRSERVSCMSNWNGAVETNVIEIKVNPAYSYSSTVTICQGESHSWHGNNYSAAGTYTVNYSTINGCDSIYILNLIVNPTYSFNENYTICNGQIYNWHGNNYSSAGTYTAAYASIYGCDSIYVLNLTINTVDVSLTLTGLAMIANLSGGTYQWLDCNNNYSPISGATSQSYTPTVNGSYAVLISLGSCSDTSACIQIINVGISSHDFKETLIYPNPVINDLMIEMNGNNEKTDYEMFDSIGQVVCSGNFREKLIIPMHHLVNGVYFLKLKNGNNTEIKKIIKQQ